MKQVTSTKTEHNFFTRLESELDEDEIFSSDKPKNTLLEQFLYTCSISKMSFPLYRVQQQRLYFLRHFIQLKFCRFYPQETRKEHSWQSVLHKTSIFSSIDKFLRRVVHTPRRWQFFVAFSLTTSRRSERKNKRKSLKHLMTFEVFGFQIREPDEFRRESKHNLRKSVVISSEPWKHRLKRWWKTQVPEERFIKKLPHN